LVAGDQRLAAGFWRLAAGSWLLVPGCCWRLGDWTMAGLNDWRI